MADANARDGADCPLMTDQRLSDAAAVLELLHRPAARRAVISNRLLLALASICVLGGAVFATTSGDGGSGWFVPRVAVPLGLIIACVAASRAIMDRRSRDRATARTAWLFLAGGVVIALIAPATALALGLSDSAGASLATAGQLLCVVAVGIFAWLFTDLRRHTGLRGEFVWAEVLVGAAGLSLLTLTLADSVVAAGVAPQVRIRPVLDLIAVLVVIFLCVRCRGLRGLGGVQLLLFLTATYLYVTVDVASVVWPTEWWGVPVQAVLASALVTAVWLVVAAVDRPAFEPETRAGEARRRAMAGGGIAVPIVAAILIVVWGGSRDGGGLLGIMTVLTTVLLGALAYWRLVVVDDGVGTAVAGTGFEASTDRAWFRTLLGHASDVVSVTDLEGRIVYQTPSVSRVLGYQPGSWRDRKITELVDPDDAELLSVAMAFAARNPGESRVTNLMVRCSDDSWRDTETRVSALPTDEGLQGFVFTTRDVSDRRRMSETLVRQAETDELTGLPNRSALRRNASGSLRGLARAHVAVLALDLDGFGALNDTLGHEIGDEILRQVAGALRRCVRPWDVVARIGGDEFAVLIVGANAERSVNRVQDRLRRSLAAVVVGDGREVRLALSAGYAVNDSGRESADELLRNADLALARARTAHRVDLLRFEAPMHEALILRVQAEQELRAAIEARQLELAYQPVVALADGGIVGAEALVRWRHPERGLVAARDFVPLAEEMGLVHELGAWALRQACRDLATLRRTLPGFAAFKMSVNVSAHQVEHELVRQVASAVGDAGVIPSDLILEITESALAKRPDEASDVLARLRALGCQVALDDFGTGYSSLSYLAQFPVDILKIDRTFVGDVAENPQCLALTRTIVALGQALHLATVAEGVETVEQADLLRGMGCEHAQGYVFSHAVPLASLMAALAAQSEAEAVLEEASVPSPADAREEAVLPAPPVSMAERVVVLPDANPSMPRSSVGADADAGNRVRDSGLPQH